VCQQQAALFDLGAPGPATTLNAGRWAGDPRRASSRRHVAGPAPLPLQDGTWQHRTPSRGRGSGPPRPVRAVWPVMVRPSHVAAPDPPGRGLPESSPAFLGTWGPRFRNSTGRVRRPRSQLSDPGRMPRPPEGKREDYGLRDACLYVPTAVRPLSVCTDS
jgi:hypothetical protein